jgi:hypothetical protein
MPDRTDLLDAVLHTAANHDDDDARQVTDKALLLQREICTECDRAEVCPLRDEVLSGERSRCPGAEHQRRRRAALGLDWPPVLLLQLLPSRRTA